VGWKAGGSWNFSNVLGDFCFASTVPVAASYFVKDDLQSGCTFVSLHYARGRQGGPEPHGIGMLHKS
jgi:hypothetical protein